MYKAKTEETKRRKRQFPVITLTCLSIADRTSRSQKIDTNIGELNHKINYLHLIKQNPWINGEIMEMRI